MSEHTVPARIGLRKDMAQSGRVDRKLSEVRGVLHRLQGLPPERQSAASRPDELGFRRGYMIGIASTTTVLVTVAVILIFGYALPGFGPQGNSTPKDGANRQPAASKLPDGSRVFTGPMVSRDERPGASTTVSPAVEAAQALMSTGRVQAARQQLLAMASDGSPDIAWALARSYDPNHLKGIEGADAGPDVAEATRWYRMWHAAAVKQRMIPDSVPLEKIIGSMRP
jgi:hypothetical protein